LKWAEGFAARVLCLTDVILDKQNRQRYDIVAFDRRPENAERDTVRKFFVSIARSSPCAGCGEALGAAIRAA